MTILSTYHLDDSNNQRIQRTASEFGGRLIYGPEDTDARIALLEEHIGEADLLLGGRLTLEQWQKAVRLKWIHVPWAGVNSLMAVSEIRQSDILITNSSGVMSDSVADQTMGYVLMLNRDLHRQIRRQSQSSWDRYELESPRRQVLCNKTIGIAGYGSIGRAVAGRARAFGTKVIALTHNAQTTPPDLDEFYAPDQLSSFLAASDFVVVALPLTAETEGMFGREQFQQMKPTAHFINIARGAIVRQNDLIEALGANEIAGAALDVFDPEPLPTDSPLWTMDNVILTPHSSGGHLGFRSAVVDLFLDNLQRYMEGKELLNVVQKEMGY